MISLLIWLLVLVLVMGVAVWIIQLMPLPAPFGNIALAVIGLIFILVIISVLLGEIPIRPVHLN